MEEKNNCVKVGFSTILWTVSAILLCAAPCGWAVDITEPITGPYYAEGEVNVYADITYGLSAQPDSNVNIYAGAIGDGLNYGITVIPDQPLAAVSVHGKAFALNGEVLDPIPDQVTFTDGTGTLTVTYYDDTTADLIFYSDIPINLLDIAASGPEEITIDIKPGSDPNPINQGSNGLIPVAIFTAKGFNAADVNPDTVTLNGAGVAVRGKAEKLMARLEDVDGDGDDDLILQVETQSEGVVWETGPVTLTGKTYDGDDIKGTDNVVIVPPE